MKVLRNELKYYIRYSDYKLLSKVLKSFLRPDKYSQNGSYFIRSLYFDTLNNKAYYEKMYGLTNRKKFRLRIYNLDDDKVKFEIKNKAKDKIYKETAIVNRKDTISFLKGNYDVLLQYNNWILNKIYCTFKKEKMHPVVLVDYQREAYTYDYNNIRITFDTTLMQDSSNFNLFEKPASCKPILNQNKVIMEVKYNHFLPPWIHDILTIVPSVRSAISKYCIARDGV